MPLPNRPRGMLRVNATKSYSPFTSFPAEWQRTQRGLGATVLGRSHAANGFTPPGCVRSLWQAPQYIPFMLSAARMSVPPAFIAKPMSTWQSRQVYFARWSQWSNTAGASPAFAERFAMTTRPNSCGSGRRFFPGASPAAEATPAARTASAATASSVRCGLIDSPCAAGLDRGARCIRCAALRRPDVHAGNHTGARRASALRAFKIRRGRPGGRPLQFIRAVTELRDRAVGVERVERLARTVAAGAELGR